MEHLVPMGNGGANNSNNVVFAHTKCNSDRGRDESWIPFHVHQQPEKIVKKNE